MLNDKISTNKQTSNRLVRRYIMSTHITTDCSHFHTSNKNISDEIFSERQRDEL